MKFNIVGFDHMNMTVPNLEEAKDWYHRVFGFEVVEQGGWDDVPWVIIRRNDSMLCLYERPELQKVEGRPDTDVHWISHFGVRIDDESAWAEVVKRENLETFYGSPFRYNHSKSWYVRDPAGRNTEVVKWDGDKVQFDK